ncbi:hypothetical protein HaGV_gp171 [Helicoverpa armigera granulovirus]|uniref:Uncharacterized protein n=2 Tax=Betabaculovirus TaxID=558017 RepID=A9YN13_9BBAC|nr:ORF173 [Xestia c-nigrum granulovirus]YP_001649153.1 hypothetical protein HaGV_gp171 [Helicoverpa armigera granulovirus]AAF05287.1 ORF173 [Xestia c-nigrum granulovirus]ABY47862.1 unknown [Helicoverpa armigera granulovirus]
MSSNTSLIFKYNVFLINSSDKIFLDGFRYVNETAPGQYVYQNLYNKELVTLPFKTPTIDTPVTQFYY